MTKQSTNTTGRNLVPENHYDNAMVTKVTRKEIKGGYIIYEWDFEAVLTENGESKPFYFKIGMFASQMAELLRALGATEVTPGNFDWDDEAVIGEHLSFNVAHVEDKKGNVREQLSDITRVTAGTVTDPANIAWGEEDAK